MAHTLPLPGGMLSHSSFLRDGNVEIWWNWDMSVQLNECYTFWFQFGKPLRKGSCIHTSVMLKPMGFRRPLNPGLITAWVQHMLGVFWSWQLGHMFDTCGYLSREPNIFCSGDSAYSILGSGTLFSSTRQNKTLIKFHWFFKAYWQLAVSDKILSKLCWVSGEKKDIPLRCLTSGFCHKLMILAISRSVVFLKAEPFCMFLPSFTSFGTQLGFWNQLCKSLLWISCQHRSVMQISLVLC